MNGEKCLQSRSKIEKWLKKEGVALMPGLADQYDREKMTITYNKRNKIENQIYSILHECGHYLVQQSTSYNSKYKIQNEALEDGRKKRSVSWRVSILREEFQAWDKGRELSRILGLRINPDTYDKYSAECLRSYCNWVVSPNEYTLGEE